MLTSSYVASATIFNGAIQSAALAVVRPTSASHVSATIKFCRGNGLDISVKAGGSGVHGQSVRLLLPSLSFNMPILEFLVQKTIDYVAAQIAAYTHRSQEMSLST